MSVIVSTVALLVSLTATGVGVYSLYRLRSSRLEERVEELENTVGELDSVEEEVFAEESSYEEFKSDIEDLSERLFHLTRSKYDLDVSTYEELVEELEELDIEDERGKRELIKFFNYLIKLEYSDEELDESDRALLRQAAFNLIRKAGPALKTPEESREEG